MLLAATVSDLHSCPSNSLGPILIGATTVFINGKPAARTGDPVACTKPEFIAGGEESVQIEGKSAARLSDMVERPNACPGEAGGVIITGSPNVLIGSSYHESVLRKASENGAPFCDPFDSGQTDSSKNVCNEIDRSNAILNESNAINQTGGLIQHKNIPSPPPPPPVDAGAGVHGAEEAEPSDYNDKTKWNVVSNLAEVYGYTDAGRHMRHYLNNTGDDIILRPERLMRDMPAFKDQVDNDLKFFQNQIQTSMQKEYNDNEVTKQFTAQFGKSKWKGYYATKEQSGNWYYSMGGFSYTFTALAKTIPPSNNTKNPQINMKYQMHIHDQYNWDKGKGVAIGNIVPVQDDSLGKLHRAGIAKEYKIKGSSDVKEIVIPLEADATEASNSQNETRSTRRKNQRKEINQKMDRTGMRSDLRRDRD